MGGGGGFCVRVKLALFLRMLVADILKENRIHSIEVCVVMYSAATGFKRSEKQIAFDMTKA